MAVSNKLQSITQIPKNPKWACTNGWSVSAAGWRRPSPRRIAHWLFWSVEIFGFFKIYFFRPFSWCSLLELQSCWTTTTWIETSQKIWKKLTNQKIGCEDEMQKILRFLAFKFFPIFLLFVSKHCFFPPLFLLEIGQNWLKIYISSSFVVIRLSRGVPKENFENSIRKFCFFSNRFSVHFQTQTVS